MIIGLNRLRQSVFDYCQKQRDIQAEKYELVQIKKFSMGLLA